MGALQMRVLGLYLLIWGNRVPEDGDNTDGLELLTRQSPGHIQ